MDEVKKGPGRPKTVVQETPNLTHPALGLYQGADKLWYIAVLKFNPETGHATVDQRILAGEDKYFANEMFKIKTIELEMI
jgi:hypothetical protein